MISEVELNIYMNNGENTSLSLTPTQTETIFKALGIKIDDAEDQGRYYINMFADNSLRDIIIPKVNFKELNERKEINNQRDIK